MPDAFPSRRQFILGVVATTLLVMTGSIAVEWRAVEECRSAMSHATTSYKIEKVLRSEPCLEARRDGLRR